MAIPLVARGISVTGIELSQPMVDRLRRKVPAEELPLVVGYMATTGVPGWSSLVYVVWNSIGNLRTQDEQVRCFRHAPGTCRRAVVSSLGCGYRKSWRFPPG